MILHNFGLFLITSFVLLIMPGPSVLYIAARSMEQGRIAGLVSVFGTALGTIVLVIASAVGLSAILASSSIAFSIVKYLGAIYLIYLGIKELRTKTVTTHVVVQPKKFLRIFVQGVFVAVLNPKTAIFFLAFLPQFIKPSYGLIWTQTIELGLSLVVLGVFTDSLYVLLAGTLGNMLQNSLVFRSKQHYISTLIYLTLGALTIFSDSGLH